MLQLIFDFFGNIYDFLTGNQFSRLTLALEIISWAISILLMFLIVVLIRRSDATWVLRERKYARQIAKGPQHTEQKWQNILARLDKNDEANIKMAVIEADSLLADVLQFVVPSLATTGERLEKIDKTRLPSLDRVWEAHRLRNFIVHNHKVPITRQQAQEAIESFEQGLKDLEYL